MIDKTAIIHPGAQIADDAIIGPYVVIGENVKIGSKTRVISNAFIEHAEIGERCTISPFATIGSEPQDLGYKGEPTKVVIGNDTIIKENVTIHRGAACGDFTTRIGNKCLLMVGSHVAHNCVLADEVILANLVTLAGQGVIKKTPISLLLNPVFSIISLRASGFNCCNEAPRYSG